MWHFSKKSCRTWQWFLWTWGRGTTEKAPWFPVAWCGSCQSDLRIPIIPYGWTSKPLTKFLYELKLYEPLLVPAGPAVHVGQILMVNILLVTQPMVTSWNIPSMGSSGSIPFQDFLLWGWITFIRAPVFWPSPSTSHIISIKNPGIQWPIIMLPFGSIWRFSCGVYLCLC